MARRKKGIRISKKRLAEARKKIKSTPKRGRWPKFDDIVDKDDFIRLAKNPSLIETHPKAGTVCFTKTVTLNFRDEIDEFLSAIRFRCPSYDGGNKDLLDTTCTVNYGVYSERFVKDPASIRAACQRISCPYYKKGFIGIALKEKLFEDDVNPEIKREDKKEKKK